MIVLKKLFRYDYNYKLLIVCNFVSIIFLILFIASYNKGPIIFCFFGFALLISLFNSFVFINNQGIKIKNDNIKVVDYLWFTKIKLNDLKYAEIQELKKEKRSNLYGFFHEFYHPTTYMYKCDYIYNNGKVFNIIFHLKDGTNRKTYFGWMYKEKNELKTIRITDELYTFVNTLNAMCKKQI